MLNLVETEYFRQNLDKICMSPKKKNWRTLNNLVEESDNSNSDHFIVEGIPEYIP